jgi:hypothetical protein
MNKLDKDTVNFVLTMIKDRINPEINIMDFYAYDPEEEDKHGFRYRGTVTPSEIDWKLAKTYFDIKQVCEYCTGFSTSFTMELIGE